MRYLLLAAAILVTLPALAIRAAGAAVAPVAEAVLFGFAIFGAAFLLAWAAELAQLEISQALAVAILALIAVLPEYAVDLYFAWTAAERPAYAAYATANMTGANRLLVGLGWPLIVVLYALRHRRRSVTLHPAHSVETAYLGIASLYALLIPIRGSLSLIDTAILLAVFALYMVRTAQAPVHEPVLVGPPASLARLHRRPRRIITIAMFLHAGIAILLAAEPFAEALIESGHAFGIDEFILVQWVAPIASEAPEFIIAALWALRGDAQSGLGALISSKVNQWTLLIGTIPLVYSISLGRPGALPLDSRQEHELWLTSTQSLLATMLLLNLDLSILEALILFVLFAAQLLVPDIRIEVAILYSALSVLYLVLNRTSLIPVLRAGLRGRRAGT